MEKDECWAAFLASGKVTDYLSYRQAASQTAGDAGSAGDGRAQSERPDDKGKHNAGFY